MQQSSPFLPLPLSLLCPCAVVDHPSERSSIYISNRISVFPHHRQHGPRLLGNVCLTAVMMNRIDTANGFRSQPHKGQLHCSSLLLCTDLHVNRSTVHFFKRGTAPISCKRAVHLSMAPLSLLGTVIRDKMMKTVTVQVNARCDMHNFLRCSCKKSISC